MLEGITGDDLAIKVCLASAWNPNTRVGDPTNGLESFNNPVLETIMVIR